MSLRRRYESRVNGIKVKHAIVIAVADIQRYRHVDCKTAVAHRVVTREQSLVIGRVAVASQACIVTRVDLDSAVKKG